MAESLLAIDPGEVTGWSLWALDPEFPLSRLEYGLVKGGAEGWFFWQEHHLGTLRPDVIVFERFNPNLGYGKSKDYSALVIEGGLRVACRALALEVTMHGTDMKALCRDEVLKQSGLWVTREQARNDPAIMHEDARDVNDSQIHALAWAKASGHEPTIRAFWPDL